MENLSNSSNIIKFNTKTEKGWQVEYYVDENADGRRQENENTKLNDSYNLSEGATLYFLARAIKPSNVREGDTASINIEIYSVEQDGNEYVGDNGIIYGGPDKIILKDKVVIE